ncbi:hypothetical protein [Bradyrhizobium sp. USDA 10063]
MVLRNTPDQQPAWRRVIHAAECDAYGNCPVCGIDYAECDCPGPSQADEFEYRVRDGVLWARRWLQ